MQFLIVFLEGIVTFISPCLLPLLPVYIFYFAGDGESSPLRAFVNSLGFVLGFTTVFVLLGALAGSLGSLLTQYQTAVNIVTGGIVVLLGLSYLGVIQLRFLKGPSSNRSVSPSNFLSAFVFGIVFSVSWTPCVGAFLGSALMLASQQGQQLTGVLMLLAYSAGLGIPFIASSLLIDQLKGLFDTIKSHYGVIIKVCGGMLILLGVLMMTGRLGALIAALA